MALALQQVPVEEQHLTSDIRIRIVSTAISGFYRSETGSIMRRARPNVEQLAIQGALLSEMEGVDDIPIPGRNYAAEYLKAVHLVKVRQGTYFTHAAFECTEHHELLHAFWKRVRKERREEERRRKKEGIAMLKEQRQRIHDVLLAAGTKLSLEEPLPVQLAWQSFLLRPKGRVGLDKIVRLYDRYLIARENGERPSFKELGKFSGISSSPMTVREYLQIFSFESLIRIVKRTGVLPISAEERDFLQMVHETPFRPCELYRLLEWPRGRHSLETLLNRLGKRPWAAEVGMPGSKRTVPSYITAATIYREHDMGLNKTEIAEQSKRAPSTVNYYLRRRAEAEPQILSLLEASGEFRRRASKAQQNSFWLYPGRNAPLEEMVRHPIAPNHPDKTESAHQAGTEPSYSPREHALKHETLSLL